MVLYNHLKNMLHSNTTYKSQECAQLINFPYMCVITLCTWGGIYGMCSMEHIP